MKVAGPTRRDRETLRPERARPKAALASRTSAAPEASSGRARSRRRRAPGAGGEHARKIALAVAEAGLDKKALNVEIIDVREKVDYADYVVVMSGRSERQVSALARHIDEQLARRHKEHCEGIEGLPQGSWVLMDYADVVVHIFHEDTRGYYDLESLWIDAARVSLE